MMYYINYLKYQRADFKIADFKIDKAILQKLDFAIKRNVSIIYVNLNKQPQ